MHLQHTIRFKSIWRFFSYFQKSKKCRVHLIDNIKFHWQTYIWLVKIIILFWPKLFVLTSYIFFFFFFSVCCYYRVSKSWLGNQCMDLGMSDTIIVYLKWICIYFLLFKNWLFPKITFAWCFKCKQYKSDYKLWKRSKKTTKYIYLYKMH